MNKPPAFQFYPDDFLGGTVSMNFAQRGLYITLLSIQWNQGFITQEDMEGLISDGSAIAQPLAKRVFSKFEKCEDGLFRNSRLEKVRAEQKEFRASRSRAGKSGAEARWGKHGTAIAQPMANHMAKDSSPTPTPINTHTLGDANIPTWDEVKAAASIQAVPESSARTFFDHHENNQLWVNQFNRLIDWRRKLITWAANDRQKQDKTKPAKPTHAPTKQQVLDFAADKAGSKPEVQAFTLDWHRFWSAKGFIKQGKPMDWQSELAIQLANKRF